MLLEIRTKDIHIKFAWRALSMVIIVGLCMYFDLPLPWQNGEN